MGSFFSIQICKGKRLDLSGARCSVTVSFRLDAALRNRLTYDANAKHISLNAYVQEVLQKSIDWDALRPSFELVTVSKETLKIFLDRLTEADLAATARSVLAPRLKEQSNLMRGKTDVDGLLRALELSAKYAYPFPVTFSVHEDSDGHHILMLHGISRKWSIYLGEGCLAYLEALHFRGSYEALEKSLNLTISGKKPQRK